MKRIKRSPDDADELGMMGIGTLIIFIAIVLVAAVSAGVFIRTVTELKGVAEQTVSQAAAEVSTFLNVRSIYGETNPERTRLDVVKINLGLGPGSPSQNLNFTLIQVIGREFEQELRYSDTPGTDVYTARELLDPHGEFDSVDNPIIEPGATIQIEFNVEAFELGPQSDLEIHMMPKHGSTVVESFYTPTVYNRDILPLG